MKVVVAKDATDVSTWLQHDIDGRLVDFLMAEFGTWPGSARIYHGQVDAQHDVTPFDDASVEALAAMPGPFYVVVYPGDPVTIVVAIVAVIVAAVVLVQLIPTPALRNSQSTSPNNELSERTNKPRPLARIPDIYGTVRSTPDLLVLPYKAFIDHQEVEYTYACIGRGSFDVDDVRDGNTLVSDIAGTSVAVYAPGTSPNSGDPAQLQVGDPIGATIASVFRSNAVNGQVLRPPNEQKVASEDSIYFEAPNLVKLVATPEFDDFSEKFEAGDTLIIADSAVVAGNVQQAVETTFYDDGSFRFEIPGPTLPAEFTAGARITITGATMATVDADSLWTDGFDLNGTQTIESVVLDTEAGPTYFCHVYLDNPSIINPDWDTIVDGSVATIGINTPLGTGTFDLDGTYTVLAVSADTITLSSPSAVNANWSSLTVTAPGEAVLTTTGPKWVGPFTLDRTDNETISTNFVALNGLYKDNGKNQYRFDVTVELEITPVNADDSPRGPVQTEQVTLLGSTTLKSTRAATMKVAIDDPGRVSVRARRITATDSRFKGSVIDEIKWRDLYSLAEIDVDNFGDVTTVQSITFATSGALAVKERKLNMLVTRKLPQRVSGSTFTTELFATNSAADIFSAVCLDPYIGARDLDEVDFDAVYDAIADSVDYFGSALASEFCYTFDSANLSFEEIAQSVADAAFCIAYRRGNVLKINFEKENDESVLLFNHRNKLPSSEARTVRFGNEKGYDGVTLKYVSNVDDAIVNYYIPADRSAVNPHEIETIGIRNGLQAYLHAWRKWNKIRYRNTVSEFTATQEADLLVVNDRILVADNTRSGTKDGEVVSQDVLELTLSQPVVFEDGSTYQIFLQHVDGTVESIAATAGSDDHSVVLAQAPRLALALDSSLSARTTYILAANGQPRALAFLLTKKEPKGNFTVGVQAVNYDLRYYAQDLDFVNGNVDEDGNDI